MLPLRLRRLNPAPGPGSVCYLSAVQSALMIVNRHAGRKGTRRAAERAAVRMRDRGVDVRLERTGSAEEAAALIATTAPNVDAVVSVGGDGTVRGVVDALLASGIEVDVGIIPRGTANVVARELGVPIHPVRAADVVVDGTPRRIDVGKVNDETFLAMVGIGLDATIVQGVRPGRLKLARMGWSSMQTLARPRFQPLRILVNGEEITEPSFSAVVTNTRNYAGWFSLCPAAAPDDGRFDLIRTRRRDRRAILRLVSAAVRWRPTSARVAAYSRGETFLIESTGAHQVPVQADGDPCGTTPVRISIVKSAVAIIAPATNGAPS